MLRRKLGVSSQRSAKSEGPLSYSRALRAPLVVSLGVKSKSGGPQTPYTEKMGGASPHRVR